MPTSQHRLQIVITAGTEDVARAEVALQMGLAAACTDIEVVVFLTLRGSIWACDAKPAGNTKAVSGLVDQLLELGVTIECCSKCVEKACCRETRTLNNNDIRSGIKQVGLVTLATRAAQGVPTVTF